MRPLPRAATTHAPTQLRSPLCTSSLPQLALAAAGIIPSNKTSYPARAVARAVEDAFRVQPLLNCHRGQLLEVWLCVGLDLQVGGGGPGWGQMGLGPGRG